MNIFFLLLDKGIESGKTVPQGPVKTTLLPDRGQNPFLPFFPTIHPPILSPLCLVGHGSILPHALRISLAYHQHSLFLTQASLLCFVLCSLILPLPPSIPSAHDIFILSVLSASTGIYIRNYLLPNLSYSFWGEKYHNWSGSSWFRGWQYGLNWRQHLNVIFHIKNKNVFAKL